MEGEAVRDAGWPDAGQSDLHKGKTGAIAFHLTESSGMRASLRVGGSSGPPKHLTGG